MWQLWRCKTMCHPCMMMFSRCRSEVFHLWLWRQNSVWLCIELWSRTAFGPSELFCGGNQTLDLVSLWCSTRWKFMVIKWINVYLWFRYMECFCIILCIYFPYWFKRLMHFKNWRSLFCFKKVNKLKHWLLFPESQDTIQGLMKCTRSCCH